MKLPLEASVRNTSGSEQFRKKVYFLSDLHLGSRSLSDPKGAEKKVVEFLNYIGPDASQIYLLGDVLDYWFEYRYVVPRGFVRFFGKLAELSDAGVEIIWLIGNHDIWIFDYLPSELGVKIIDGAVETEILGKQFFLSHGDGLGRIPKVFASMRSLFRNRFCQKLYSSIHPRWTVPFALGWSKNSRKHSPDSYPKEEESRGVKVLQDYAFDYAKTHPEINYYIFGHVHSQSKIKIESSGTEIITLGGWLSECDYAVFDGTDLILKRWRGV